MSRNVGTLTSWNALGHPRPVTGLLYLYLVYIASEDYSHVFKTARFRNFFGHQRSNPVDRIVSVFIWILTNNYPGAHWIGAEWATGSVWTFRKKENYCLFWDSNPGSYNMYCSHNSILTARRNGTTPIWYNGAVSWKSCSYSIGQGTVL
jgi:hypothetical protein